MPKSPGWVPIGNSVKPCMVFGRLCDQTVGKVVGIILQQDPAAIAKAGISAGCIAQISARRLTLKRTGVNLSKLSPLADL